MLSTRPRRIIAAIVLFFVLYSIYNSPDSSADVVRRIWDILSEAVRQIFRFFDSVIDEK